MSDYRRWFVEGGTVFLTLVSYNRRPILTSEYGRRFLRLAIGDARVRLPFEIVATVLLPDHWHVVMRLPQGDCGYSARIRKIKIEFSKRWISAGLAEAEVTSSQHERGYRGIWQPRFWEHTVRDESDLERCCDYIHWNPRKHDLVARVSEWRWSSFHRFVEMGHYAIDWGGTAPRSVNGADFGEP
ncbi:MAG: transposase [Planctomycetota bacterium]